MTQDEIIEMARQAGFKEESFAFQRNKYEAFAKLVAAKEREACAKVCDEWANSWSGEPEMEEMAAEIRARGEA
jgi:hypothetical protein